MKTRIAAIGLAAVLGACALFNPYAKLVPGGQGYSDVRLAPDTFRVTYLASEAGGFMRANDLVLLRSAEVTLAHDYRYFVVMSEERETRTSSYDVPASQSTETTTTSTRKPEEGEKERRSTSTTTYTAAKTVVSNQPQVTQLIRAYEQPPKDAGGRTVYDAEFLWREIGGKYEVKRAPQR